MLTDILAGVGLVAGLALLVWWLRRRTRAGQVQVFYPEEMGISLRKMVERRDFRPTIMVIKGKGRAHQGYEVVEVLGMDDDGYVQLVQSQIRATDEGGSYPPLDSRVTTRYVWVGEEVQNEEGNFEPYEVLVWRPFPEDERSAREQIEAADQHIQNVRAQYDI